MPFYLSAIFFSKSLTKRRSYLERGNYKVIVSCLGKLWIFMAVMRSYRLSSLTDISIAASDFIIISCQYHTFSKWWLHFFYLNFQTFLSMSFITFPVWKRNKLNIWSWFPGHRIEAFDCLYALVHHSSSSVLFSPHLYCWRLNTKLMPSEVIHTKRAGKVIFLFKSHFSV